jgi:hypothetical protein
MMLTGNLNDIIFKNTAMERDEFLALQALRGGIGCDLVSGTANFKARLGTIYGVQSNADGSRLSQITEVVSNLGTAADSKDLTGAHRSYLGAVDVNDGKWVLFDNPVSHIKPSAGSFWVYYQKL